MGQDSIGEGVVRQVSGKAWLPGMGVAPTDEPTGDLGRDDGIGEEANEEGSTADWVKSCLVEFLITVIEHSTERISVQVRTLDGILVAEIDSADGDSERTVAFMLMSKMLEEGGVDTWPQF